MSEVERLRAEVAKKRRNVNAKINRIQKSSGALVGGSEFDPRRAPGVEKKYNARQLNAYLNTMNSFLNRNVQFVGLKGGAPAPRGEWNVYARRQEEHKSIKAARDAMMGGIETPSGMTIAGNKQMMFEGQGKSNFGPYKTFDRMPQDIASRKALGMLSADMLKRIKPDYVSNKVSQGRGALQKALEAMGDSELFEGYQTEEGEVILGVKDLTDYQFDLFWFGTNVAESTFMRYGIIAGKNSELEGDATPKERWQDRAVDDAYKEFGSVLKWASERTPGDGGSTPPKTSGRKPRKR